MIFTSTVIMLDCNYNIIFVVSFQRNRKVKPNNLSVYLIFRKDRAHMADKQALIGTPGQETGSLQAITMALRFHVKFARSWKLASRLLHVT